MLKVILVRCVSIVNITRFASVKENLAACKAKPTSNLKDIILIQFYCYRCFGQYSFEDLTLNISGKLIQ